MLKFQPAEICSGRWQRSASRSVVFVYFERNARPTAPQEYNSSLLNHFSSAVLSTTLSLVILTFVNVAIMDAGSAADMALDRWRPA